jgi:hypothetical protein
LRGGWSIVITSNVAGVLDASLKSDTAACVSTRLALPRGLGSQRRRGQAGEPRSAAGPGAIALPRSAATGRERSLLCSQPTMSTASSLDPLRRRPLTGTASP